MKSRASLLVFILSEIALAVIFLLIYLFFYFLAPGIARIIIPVVLIFIFILLTRSQYRKYREAESLASENTPSRPLLQTDIGGIPKRLTGLLILVILIGIIAVFLFLQATIY